MSSNTYSISLLTANPSNIILGEVLNIDFIEYLEIMLLDGIIIGICCAIYSFIWLKLINK